MAADRRSHLSDAPWRIAVRPGDDELLTSYLCRTAAANGLTPYAFGRIHFSTRLWTGDLDRTPPSEVVLRLERLAALEAGTLASLTLDGPQPWILEVGVFHRLRRRHGQRYCPLCMQEPGGFLKRAWRLAWVGACDRHGIELEDACPNCGDPLATHRAVVPTQCWKCLAMLGQQATRAASDARLELQSKWLGRWRTEAEQELFEAAAITAAMLRQTRADRLQGSPGRSRSRRVPAPRGG